MMAMEELEEEMGVPAGAGDEPYRLIDAPTARRRRGLYTSEIYRRRRVVMAEVEVAWRPIYSSRQFKVRYVNCFIVRPPLQLLYRS